MNRAAEIRPVLAGEDTSASTAEETGPAAQPTQPSRAETQPQPAAPAGHVATHETERTMQEPAAASGQGLARSSAPAAADVAPVLPPPLPGAGLPEAPMPDQMETGPAPSTPQVFNLNFDNADLNEVIDVLAKSLQLNYVVDPRVKGTVTIHTAGRISRGEIFSVLETILKMNAVAIVKAGDVYKIMPFSEAQSEPMSPYLGEDLRGPARPSGQQFIIQIIPLRFISASQMAKILKPFLTPGATVSEVPVASALVVSDMAANIEKLIQMVKAFDIRIFENIRVEIFSIQNTSAEEVTTELESIFGAYGLLRTEKEPEAGIKFIPIPRLNSVLAIASNAEILNQAGDWTKKLDQRAELGTDVHVYFVENVKSVDLAAVLNQVYASGGKQPAAGPAAAKAPRGKAAGAKPPEAAPDLTGEVRIIPDEASNALVIMATPEDYKTISQTVKKLDIVPRQVHIDVLIAEVTLGDSLQYGVGWALQHEEIKIPELGGSLASRIFFNEKSLTAAADATNPVFGYRLLDSANNVRALLSLLAGQSRLNVLSAPNIIASNNQKASINVGAQVPIVTSEYVPLAPTATTDQTQQPITSRSVQYKDTGVILTVTPHINSARLVTLEISQEVSSAQTTTTGVTSSPTFLTRKAETSIVIHDGQTALIGGLIKEEKQTSDSGIPYLKDIPLVGWLFGTRSTTVDRTELLVLLTPRVIIEREELDDVTRDMMEKVGSLKSMIESAKKEKK